jgi:hypothetical protein
MLSSLFVDRPRLASTFSATNPSIYLDIDRAYAGLAGLPPQVGVVLVRAAA